MDTNALRYLGLIVEQGSFSAAAAAAGVSQPAISLAMQALEKELGISIFEGQGKNKRPTENAYRVAQITATFTSNLNRVTEMAKDRPGRRIANPAKNIRIGMSPVASQIYGPSITKSWLTLSPGGRVHMSSGSAAELIMSLRQGDLDIVIAPKPRGVSLRGLETQFLTKTAPSICARVGHPAASVQSMGELKGIGWVIVGVEHGPGDMMKEAMRVRRFPRPKILAQCTDYSTCLTLVAQSDLMCVVPHPILLGRTRDGEISTLRIREGLPTYDILIFRRDEEHSKADSNRFKLIFDAACNSSNSL